MNTVIAIVHTAESLANLPRKALIKAAIEAGIVKPYTTKSVVLIQSILSTQATVAHVAEVTAAEEVVPVVVAAPAAEVSEESVTPEVAAQEVPDNVVAFDSQPPEQIEMPAPTAATYSHGLFKVSRKAFRRQLSACAKVCNVGSQMPIFSCVLISFGDGTLKVDGSDLSNHVTTTTQAETTGKHELAIPRNILSKFVSRCSSEYLMAEVIGTKLVISDLENRTEIMGITAGEFPPAPQSGTKPVMTITGKNMVRHVAETIKFASVDETRYILNGLAVDTKNKFIVATDGRRLVQADLASETIGEERTFIIPTFAAQVLAAGLPVDVVCEVTTNGDGNKLQFSSEAVGYTYRLTSRMVEDNYPNYSQVIPKDDSGCDCFTVATAELDSAIGRLLVVANAKSKDNALSLSFEEKTLTINAVNKSVGTGKELVTISGECTAKRITALNGMYLADLSGSWQDEKFTITVKSEIAPLLVRSADKLAVIMPVRV